MLYRNDHLHELLSQDYQAWPYDVYSGNFTFDEFLKIPLKEKSLDFNPKTY